MTPPASGPSAPASAAPAAAARAPWYAAGLSFACTRCGGCCTGFPGYVWVDDEEQRALAALLALPLDRFLARFTRRVRGRVTLRETSDDDCIFYDRERGCTVYAARPVQCRTYPFWPENIETPGRWRTVVRECPGAGQGQHRTREEIEAQLRRHAGRTA